MFWSKNPVVYTDIWTHNNFNVKTAVLQLYL